MWYYKQGNNGKLVGRQDLGVSVIQDDQHARCYFVLTTMAIDTYYSPNLPAFSATTLALPLLATAT